MPTYQEAGNITEFLGRLRAEAPNCDVLVIDDSSPDGTADVAHAMAEELGRIDILVNPHKVGLGDAYRAGFRRGLDGGYDVICQIDADLSFDPADLPTLVAKVVNDGHDLAIGSRYVPGGRIPDWPLHRRALSKYGNRYATKVLGLQVADATSGFRAYRAEMLRAIDPDSTRASGYGVLIELAYRVSRRGGTIAEVPVEFTDREQGHSKMSWRIAVEELILVTGWGLRDRVLRRGRGIGASPGSTGHPSRLSTAARPRRQFVEDLMTEGPPASRRGRRSARMSQRRREES